MSIGPIGTGIIGQRYMLSDEGVAMLGRRRHHEMDRTGTIVGLKGDNYVVHWDGKCRADRETLCAPLHQDNPGSFAAGPLRNPKRREWERNAWGPGQAPPRSTKDALPHKTRSTPLPNIPPSFEIKVSRAGGDARPACYAVAPALGPKR